MIVDPVTIRPDRPVHEAFAGMERFHISGVPVVDEDGHLGRDHHKPRSPVRDTFRYPGVRCNDQAAAGDRSGWHNTGPGKSSVAETSASRSYFVVDDDKHIKGLIHGQGHPESN
jgi:hypothetical protein